MPEDVRCVIKKMFVLILLLVMGFSVMGYVDIKQQQAGYEQLHTYLKTMDAEIENGSVSVSESDEMKPALSPSEINSDYLSTLSVGNIHEFVVMGDEFYLDHDFFGNFSIYGTPFVFQNTQCSDPVITIYGHSSTDGRVFSEVKEWLDADFFQQHSTLTFMDTEYQVVIAGRSDLTEAVPYFSFMNAETLTDWLIAQKEQGEVVIEFDAATASQAIVLSTCDMSNTAHRLYLIAIK